MTKQSAQLPQGLPPYLVETRLPLELVKLEQEGALSEAERLLSRAIDPASTATLPGGISADLARSELERLRRLRREFSVSFEEFLRKLAPQLPEVTHDDLERWAREGSLQCVRIDGELRIFRREPANLFRFSPEAQKRRRLPTEEGASKRAVLSDPSEKPTPHFVLNHHLRDLVRRCTITSQPLAFPIRGRAIHRVELLPGRVPPGAVVRCWLPFPRESAAQRNVSLVAADPQPLHISAADAPQRTLYFERIAEADGKAHFSATYEYLTSAYLPLLTESKTTAVMTRGELERFLGEQLPHIEFSPEVRELARQLINKETDHLARVRRIFEWVVTNIRYASEVEYCIMPRIVEKVLATRRGDCGGQALLFITLCRAAGIPARWVSGWVVYPSGWNMHDWAEFYVEPYGWLPADPSRGWREDDDPRVREFFFGNVDAYRMVANSEICAPFDPPKRFWRSDPVDNQRGELEWDGGNLYYDDWTYDVEVTTHPLD